MIKLTAHEMSCKIICMNLHPTQGKRFAIELAEEIRVEMLRQRKSARALAAELDVTEATVGARLNGRVPFDAIQIHRVTTWLGVSITEIIERAEKNMGTQSSAQREAEKAAA